MRKTIRLASLLVLAALGTAAPAAAQRENSHIVHDDETRIVHDDGRRRVEIRSRGAVEFNDAGDWVASVPAGGLFTVEERDGGERRIEFRAGGVRYFVDDRERPLDAAGRAWAQRHVLEAVRDSGIGAERRVARIRARGGVNGVLQEIGRIRSDVGRRHYYRALLGGGALSTAEFGRVMDDVGRRMSSDVETRLVLVEAAGQARDGARMAALLRAAEGMESDVETRLVLNHVSSRGRLPEGSARDAFFRAVDAFDSDVERRLVLSQVLRDDTPEATVIAAIAAAGEMNSDVEKRLVLSQVSSARLRSARVAAAYRRVAQEMSSATERRLVMRRLDGGR